MSTNITTTVTDAAVGATALGFANAASFELTQRAAKMLASSTLVPKEYQNNLANSAVALIMAQRLGADTLQVMQNLYVVHGRPSLSSQFLIACWNQSGKFSAMRYEFTGQPGTDSWGCRAYATERETGERIEGPEVTIGMAKREGWATKNGSKWQTMPELMLRYRAAAFLIRTAAPEIAMGMQTAEELRDTYDAAPNRAGTYVVEADTPDLSPTESTAAPAKSLQAIKARAKRNSPVVESPVPENLPELEIDPSQNSDQGPKGRAREHATKLEQHHQVDDSARVPELDDFPEPGSQG
jgi:hypothetical protein